MTAARRSTPSRTSGRRPHLNSEQPPPCFRRQPSEARGTGRDVRAARFSNVVGLRLVSWQRRRWIEQLMIRPPHMVPDQAAGVTAIGHEAPATRGRYRRGGDCARAAGGAFERQRAGETLLHGRAPSVVWFPSAEIYNECSSWRKGLGRFRPQAVGAGGAWGKCSRPPERNGVSDEQKSVAPRIAHARAWRVQSTPCGAAFAMPLRRSRSDDPVRVTKGTSGRHADARVQLTRDGRELRITVDGEWCGRACLAGVKMSPNSRAYRKGSGWIWSGSAGRAT